MLVAIWERRHNDHSPRHKQRSVATKRKPRDQRKGRCARVCELGFGARGVAWSARFRCGGVPVGSPSHYDVVADDPRATKPLEWDVPRGLAGCCSEISTADTWRV